MEDLGRELARLRERSGLSQADLAKRIGKVRYTVIKYESGKAVPAVETLAQICEVLGETSFVINGQRFDIGRNNPRGNARPAAKQLRLRLGIVCAAESAKIIVPSSRKANRLDVDVLSA